MHAASVMTEQRLHFEIDITSTVSKLRIAEIHYFWVVYTVLVSV